jgi:transposase
VATFYAARSEIITPLPWPTFALPFSAPKEYGPPKTLYNRWKRWGDKGVFARMMAGLAAEAAVPKTVMIDATYLKAHRTATSLRSKKGDQATRGAV